MDHAILSELSACHNQWRLFIALAHLINIFAAIVCKHFASLFFHFYIHNFSCVDLDVDAFLVVDCNIIFSCLNIFPTEGVDYSILDAKKPEDLTEEEKIALLGRPCLGQNTKLQIRIKESKEFKVGPGTMIITEVIRKYLLSQFPELCRQTDGQDKQQHSRRKLILVGTVHWCFRGSGR